MRSRGKGLVTFYPVYFLFDLCKTSPVSCGIMNFSMQSVKITWNGIDVIKILC